ncbi:MAG: response regulator transcription factor [Lachnospiraceae bacterium]|nr:response regulator transcription factor [Lachnospiraceae bacterium]
MITILIAEDDEELKVLFSEVLMRAGYHVLTAKDGEEALERLAEPVDLLVTDVRMPRMSGLELVSFLRKTGRNMPVLMITALGTSWDKGNGFRAGTDDYMVKPVDVDEMVWRVEALLRRSGKSLGETITVGGTVLDGGNLTVSQGGKTEELPKKEFALLAKLCGSLNRTFTQDQLLEDVWGMESDAGPQTLYVHINRLRERLKDNPDVEIKTVRGLGYKAVKKKLSD